RLDHPSGLCLRSDPAGRDPADQCCQHGDAPGIHGPGGDLAGPPTWHILAWAKGLRGRRCRSRSTGMTRDPSLRFMVRLEFEHPINKGGRMAGKRMRLMALPLALGLVIGACGGDGGTTTTAAQTTTCQPGQVDGNISFHNWSEYMDPELIAAFE